MNVKFALKRLDFQVRSWFGRGRAVNNLRGSLRVMVMKDRMTGMITDVQLLFGSGP